MARYLLPEASVDWHNKTPFSRDLSDIYWSRDAGVAEKTHVFTEPVLSRWQQLNAGSYFTIGELGFGFGLNFFLTVDQWRKQRTKGILHYIAFENRPVSPKDLKNLRALLPHTQVDELLRHYPRPFQGRHVIWLDKNIRLTLVFDDALDALRDTSAQIDAWYLDGFNPNKNDNLWNKRIYRQLFRLSRSGAMLTTYSVAGDVRRELTNAGFQVTRKPGFGMKREMLFACTSGDWKPANRETPRVAIIGKGLAGSYLYEALGRRSIEVQVFEDGEATSDKVPQLAVYPPLAISSEHRYRFSLAAFNYSQQDNLHFHQTGLTLNPKNATERERWKKIAAQFPDDFLCLKHKGVHFQEAGWLDSRSLTNSIPSTFEHIEEVRWDKDHWLLRGKENHYEADITILAHGAHSAPFAMPQLINVIPGLAISVKQAGVTAEVITGDATVFPARKGVSTISGIYDRAMVEPTVQHITALLGHAEESELLASMVGQRGATRDRLPICGTMPNWDDIKSPHLPGLYLLYGLGSHGATTARLCAEHIANLITGEPLALGRAMQRALATERFMHRDSA
ncbi:MAG TPA: hypothetical protein DCM54_05320 [Gammaproteobacteria bacterium]|nr:hypothetical protein [Gammaproteobacteria bacterium]